MATSPKSEPVAVAEAVRAVVLAGVAIGWVTLDDTAVEAVVTVAGALISLGLTLWARSRVSPTR